MRNGRPVSAWLAVIDPGLHTTLQDLGRFGSQRLGVPVSGALDTSSLRLANTVVGNLSDTAGLEILVAGPTMKVEAESVRIALGGSGATIEIVEGSESGAIPAWHSVSLERGTIFRIGVLAETLCAYLAVEGGFDVHPVLGSVSTYGRGRLGGVEGRALASGDRLPLGTVRVARREERTLAATPDPGHDQRIRVIFGPQHDLFIPEARQALLTSTYTISRSTDRMGMRLDGPKLTHAGGFDIVSDGTAAGSIQVPGSGQPIVLLADRQTTGGYPKIATIISADLPVVARRRPGDTVEFEDVDMPTAIAIRKDCGRLLEAAMADVVTVRDPMASFAESLYNVNLISGVTVGAD